MPSAEAVTIVEPSALNAASVTMASCVSTIGVLTTLGTGVSSSLLVRAVARRHTFAV